MLFRRRCGDMRQQRNELERNLSGNARPQSSQLADPLWTDSWPKRIRIGGGELISTLDSRTLCIPHIKTKTFGHRSFSHAAPSVWNSLPREIRHI